MNPIQPVLAIALVGSVDHGKSTLLGRLLYEVGAVPPRRVEQLREASRRRGVPVEWSFLLDSLQAERDQAVTIDVTQARVEYAGREFLFIDAPGHGEFLHNLVSGAARADVAVLLVDAAQGGREQMHHHSALLRLVGVRDVVVAVNKIDLCEKPAAAFAAVADSLRAYLEELGLKVHAIVPTNAREGINLLSPSAVTPWYSGPSLMEALRAIEPYRDAAAKPLRLPIQDVYRIDNVRLVVGRVESGCIAEGDEVRLSPSGQIAHVRSLLPAASASAGETIAHVRSLRPASSASAGENVAIEFDEDVFAERGTWISHGDRAPKLTRVFDAEIFWLAAVPLATATNLRLRLTTSDAEYRVQAVRWLLGADGISHMPSDTIPRFGIGGITLRSDRPLPVDDFETLPATGRFVLLDGTEVVGIGIADTARYPDLRLHDPHAGPNVGLARHAMSDPDRKARYGHPGAVVWLTGLSGAGKSTLAMDLERRLFASGCVAYVLDGDNLRHGLNADLGFGPDDRSENVRRAGEVAALFAEAGLICIVALISPYRDDRTRARGAARPHPFLEIFVDAPLTVCEARDPKGLYRKARAGTIAGFTGLDAPYERPEAPDLIVPSGDRDVQECERALFEFVASRVGIAI